MELFPLFISLFSVVRFAHSSNSSIYVRDTFNCKIQTVPLEANHSSKELVQNLKQVSSESHAYEIKSISVPQNHTFKICNNYTCDLLLAGANNSHVEMVDNVKSILFYSKNETCSHHWRPCHEVELDTLTCAEFFSLENCDKCSLPSTKLELGTSDWINVDPQPTSGYIKIRDGYQVTFKGKYTLSGEPLQHHLSQSAPITNVTFPFTQIKCKPQPAKADHP